jgi:hypothetical protein
LHRRVDWSLDVIITRLSSLRIQQVCCTRHHHMLTLDFTTLFFHNRSTVDKKNGSMIADWASEVNRSGQPPTRTPTRSLIGKHCTPSYASSTAVSHLRHPLALSTSSQPTAVDGDTELDVARSCKVTNSVMRVFLTISFIL